MHIQILLLKYFWKPISLFCSLFCITSTQRRAVRQNLLYSKKFPYPTVLSVADTIKLLQQGASLARLGDGEFNLALGKKSICYQKNSPELKRRMCEILNNPNGKCLVGIPPRPTRPGFFREYFTRYPSISSVRELHVFSCQKSKHRTKRCFLFTLIRLLIWSVKILIKTKAKVSQQMHLNK